MERHLCEHLSLLLMREQMLMEYSSWRNWLVGEIRHIGKLFAKILKQRGQDTGECLVLIVSKARLSGENNNVFSPYLCGNW